MDKINETNGYIDRISIKKLQEYYVYGTGIDSEDLVRAVTSDRIVAFIDNLRFGNLFFEKHIISFDEYLRLNNKIKIIIATYRYAEEIRRTFENEGLVFSEDFYIWDDRHIFCFDESSKRFVDFNRDIWNKHLVNDVKSKSEVLIPFDNKHLLLKIVPQAYCGNYFAKKYNAKIKGYFRFGAKYEDASKVLLSIFKSVNMDELIRYDLTRSQETEAVAISRSIWDSIESWKDWNDIYIYGIHFGTTIIRYMLRHFIPPFNPKGESLKKVLRLSVEYVVFWYDYFKSHDVKTVLMGDGVCWDGFIRDIAIHFGIPVYTDTDFFARLNLDYSIYQSYPYFGKFWEELTDEEKEYGIKWAKERLDSRIFGSDRYLSTGGKDINVFSLKKRDRVFEDNNKFKILICPSIFEEDCYYCGDQLFDNNHISWLMHLGEFSSITPDYDWYIKLHPSSSKRDFIIIDNFVKRYPKIKKIDSMVSPLQLKDEGLSCVLTVYGTVSYEYPLLGIQVVNAGFNPGMSFNHAWNPRSIDEYDELLLNPDKLLRKDCREDSYKCFCIEFLYHKAFLYYGAKLFFGNEIMGLDRLELRKMDMERGTWMYDEYIKKWSMEKHNGLMSMMDQIFNDLDNWKPDIFYKNESAGKCI